MTRAKRIRFGLLTIAALAALATGAQAAITEWQFETYGYWDDVTKWTNGVPDQFKDAVLDKNTSTFLGTDTANGAASLVVGQSTPSGSHHRLYAEGNASLTIANDMRLGVLSGAKGDFGGYDEEGSLSVGGNLIVGDAGGSFSYTWGTLQVTGGLYIGNSSSSADRTLGCNGNSTFGHAHIGVYGSGGLTLGGGKCTIIGDMNVGVHNGSNGGFNMDTKPTEFKVNNVVLGVEAGSQGSVLISNGITESGNTVQIAGDLTVGNYGAASMNLGSGQLTAGNITLAKEAGSLADFTIRDESSMSATNLVVGQAGDGASFYQSEGGYLQNTVVNVSGKLLIGATKLPGWDPLAEDALILYAIRYGTLNVGRLEVGAGRFGISHPEASVNVTQSLTLSADASFVASTGSTINMTGADFINYSTHPDYLWGLGYLSLIFSGGGTTWKTMEIGGKDYGADPQGFNDNFHLANLTVTGDNTRVSLKDAVNNGNRGSGNAPEALYVNTLNLNSDATLNLNNLPLYTYYNSQIHRVKAGEGSLFGDGSGQIINGSGNISGIIPLLLD
jgi:hypothetical protein